MIGGLTAAERRLQELELTGQHIAQGLKWTVGLITPLTVAILSETVYASEQSSWIWTATRVAADVGIAVCTYKILNNTLSGYDALKSLSYK